MSLHPEHVTYTLILNVKLTFNWKTSCCGWAHVTWTSHILLPLRATLPWITHVRKPSCVPIPPLAFWGLPRSVSWSPDSSGHFLLSLTLSQHQLPLLPTKDPQGSPKHSETHNSLTESTENSGLTRRNYRAEEETSRGYQLPHVALAFLIITPFPSLLSPKHCSTTRDQDRSSLLEGCPITSSPIPDYLFLKKKIIIKVFLPEQRTDWLQELLSENAEVIHKTKMKMSLFQPFQSPDSTFSNRKTMANLEIEVLVPSMLGLRPRKHTCQICGEPNTERMASVPE